MKVHYGAVDYIAAVYQLCGNSNNLVEAVFHYGRITMRVGGS
jgi:hypothetical protein